MKQALRITITLLICVCLSTTSVIGASTEKINKKVIHFNRWNEVVVDVGSVTKLEIKDNSSALRWSSNHPDVVWVDNSGWVKARRPGNAIVTATNTRGEKTQCKFVISCDGGLISRSFMKQQGASSCNKLMIVAHPDDETIFGGHNLREKGWFVVCLTNGYNERRAKEFRSILSATGNKGIILNYPDFQDGQKDDWNAVKKGLAVDIGRMIGFKKWKKIATHNQWGEYGHIHHIITHNTVKIECKEKPAYDALYYFGYFYWPNDIPYNLKRLSNTEVARKDDLLSTYQSQRGAIRNLRHMVPYENWIKAPAGEKIVNRKIKVKTKIKGKPAKGYIVKSVTLSHDTITVKGEQSRIKKLSKNKTIKLPAIKITGKRKTFKVKVPIKKLIPKRTKLGDNMPKKITVTVTVEPVPTKETVPTN